MSKAVNASWNKLQSLFSTPGSSKGTRPVSVSTGKRISHERRNSTDSARSFKVNIRSRRIFNSLNESFPSRPSSRQRSSYSSRPQSSTIHIQGITLSQLQDIYNAKCEDLNIPILKDQEQRFLTYCVRHFRNKKFDMRDTCIGVNAGRVIGKILNYSTEFNRVYLGKNVLKDEGALHIMQGIQKNMNIIHLDLSSNDLTPDGCYEILEIMSKNQSIISLDLCSHEGLHRNRVCGVGAQPLTKLLTANPILTILNLQGTSLGPEGLQFLVDGLQGNESLVSLNLKNNALGSSIDDLAWVIPNTKLEELNLSSNAFGTNGCDIIGRLLMGALGSHCPLKRLDISNNNIGPKGANKIWAGLRSNNVLSHFSLAQNPLGSSHPASMYSFFTDNVTLRHLNLSDCDLTSEGVLSVGELLARNQGLKELILSDNGIACDGAAALATGICKNSHLRILDLQNNRIRVTDIQNKGGISLANSLKANNLLEQLMLRNNNINDEGAQLFTEVAKFNQNIICLQLELNPVNRRYTQLIEEYVKRNKRLYKRRLAPHLHYEIKSLTLPSDAIDKVVQKVQDKKKEQGLQVKRLDKQKIKFEDFKKAESQKLIDLQAEKCGLQQKNAELETELNQITNELSHYKFESDIKLGAWADKLAVLVHDIKSREIESKLQLESRIREKIALDQSAGQNKVQELKTILEQAKTERASAQKMLMRIKENYDATQKQLFMTQNPGQLEREQAVYLASEKLATAKRGLKVVRRSRSRSKKRSAGKQQFIY